MKDFDFTLNIFILERKFEILGRTRKWNPLPGIDLTRYPLPEGDVTELMCPKADGIVTWASTKEHAVRRMQEAIESWLAKNTPKVNRMLIDELTARIEALEQGRNIES